MTDIPARYLKRLAIVYIRQSTERQVRLNEGSRRHQEAQVEHALRLGWPRENIVVIDCDLGHSGLDLKRRGYRQMVDLIETELAGWILVSDVSRDGLYVHTWLMVVGVHG